MGFYRVVRPSNHQNPNGIDVQGFEDLEFESLRLVTIVRLYLVPGDTSWQAVKAYED